METVVSSSRGAFRALRHRDFRLFLTGQGLSLIGTWLERLALTWLIYRMTGSTFLMGVVGFCSLFPVLPLGPVAGILADRYSRRHIMICMQALMLVQAAALAILTYTGAVTVTHIILLSLALGVLNAFEMPSRQSLYVHLVGREDLPSALALNAMTFNSARIIGPSIGGFLVAAFGEAICFGVNAFSYLAVLICLLAIRSSEPRKTEHPHPFDHLRDGFSYAWANRPLRGLLALSTLSNFASAAVPVLAPVFADQIFGRGSEGYGILTATFAFGAVLGTYTLARHGQTRGMSRIVWLSSAGVGFSLMVYSVAPVYSICLVAALAAGFASMRQLPGTNTLVQTVIEEGYRGRVMALYAMSVTGMIPLGNLVSGALAERFGARSTLFAAGLLCLLAAFAFGRVREEVERAVRK